MLKGYNVNSSQMGTYFGKMSILLVRDVDNRKPQGNDSKSLEALLCQQLLCHCDFASRLGSAVRDLHFFPFNLRVIYDIITRDNILKGSHNAPSESALDRVKRSQRVLCQVKYRLGCE